MSHKGSVSPGVRRRRVTTLVVLAAMVLPACVPPKAPPAPGGTTTTAPPTTAAATTTTIPPGPPCNASASSTHAAQASPTAPPAAATLTTAEVAIAARDASRAAVQQGANDVAVVALDRNGRPTIVSATPADVASVALATDVDLNVVAVEVPSIAHALATPTDPLFPQQWDQQSFAFSGLWPCARGAGVTVAVVDTGVQADHPDLSGRVLAGIAYLNNGPGQPGAGGTDPNGHGTHVAGIAAAGENGVGIVGVAPEATILPVRVLDASGKGLSTDIAKGITWAVDQGAAVVNLSLGSDVDSPSIDAAVDYATNHNVVVVAAAGNTGNTGNAAQFPAALPSVIAVAALRLDKNNAITIAGYSTRGDYVDVAAPGSAILSTVPPSAWAELSGTSMASPHVAGLAALIIDARGTIAPVAMLHRLTSTATDAGAPGFDPAFGWGRIDPVAAFNAP